MVFGIVGGRPLYPTCHIIPPEHEVTRDIPFFSASAGTSQAIEAIGYQVFHRGRGLAGPRTSTITRPCMTVVAALI